MPARLTVQAQGASKLRESRFSGTTGVFTPDEAAIAHAKRILQAFAEADTGLVVVDGKLIEKPVLREMHRILSIAERVSPHSDLSSESD